METKNKIQSKKIEKKQRLLTAAYQCFTEIGYYQTSIDNIVNKAHVAKGTFYLYFKDKEDILKALVDHHCLTILEDAFKITLEQNYPTFNQRALFFANYLIDFFTENKDMLEILQRNFFFPLTTQQLNEETTRFSSLLDKVIEDANLKEKYTRDQVINIVFIIIEMVGSVCYSSIIKEVPAPIATIKPSLLVLIERMIQIDEQKSIA